ncbi:deoxyribodipyrimidine photo-lyase [Allocatelliglobosispora scoriae]|uniref:Deoxyribodipyrimidine photo-lyase n=1 Tax=Allocatelliglobosispora scoriae TaxID=643052 RepID=A0A841BN35_9ACTN|nr:deoxyribodipyrimidine photo-lyase [Allocatelliglobosispora scoriae]MBB5868696.1 deoxyribodipyrimidine photo-lyase [Allocatelliglobosispora scoriae]
MRTAIVLFTRDLRVRDNPALHAAVAAADRVVPLFVADPGLRVHPHRQRFLAECLADLRESLRQRGGDLVVRRGDPVAEAVKLARQVGAFGIAASADVSVYARRRERRLTDACAAEGISLRLHPGVTIVEPGAVRPSTGGDHYKVFTPYWRAWQQVTPRERAATPRTIALPDGVTGADPLTVLGPVPAANPQAARGGEAEALRRLKSFDPSGYADQHDDLPGDATSRLSSYLHFGCVSPQAVASTVENEAFVRQLCWRDFYHQVLHSFGDLPSKAYRTGAVEDWRTDEHALDAWREGQTGIPIVDAGMRQLAAEGFMHNRARMITASYLTKQLGLDWRDGAAHFMHLLTDADVANNFGNWQWIAGTGNDTKPYRRFNPLRQAERFDPDGDYVRRYIPELAGVEGKAVHRPWLLSGGLLGTVDYAKPLIDPPQ